MTLPTTRPSQLRNVVARGLLAAFTLLGLAAAAVAMYAAWQHNPQGEFHDETGVHWLYWIGIGFSWFAVIAGIPWIIAAAVTVYSRFSRR